jgi:hypothetical protein
MKITTIYECEYCYDFSIEKSPCKKANKTLKGIVMKHEENCPGNPKFDPDNFEEYKAILLKEKEEKQKISNEKKLIRLN